MSYFIESPTQSFPATNPQALVEYFRKKSHTGRHLSSAAYMLYFAGLFNDFSDGLSLRADSPEHFVVDLIAYGWLYIT